MSPGSRWGGCLSWGWGGLCGLPTRIDGWLGEAEATQDRSKELILGCACVRCWLWLEKLLLAGLGPSDSTLHPVPHLQLKVASKPQALLVWGTYIVLSGWFLILGRILKSLNVFPEVMDGLGAFHVLGGQLPTIPPAAREEISDPFLMMGTKGWTQSLKQRYLLGSLQ